MNTGEIILLVLGVIIIVLAVKGKPLYQFLVKLGNRNSRAFPYLLIGGGLLLIWGLVRILGLNMDVMIGAGIIGFMMFVVLLLDPDRHKD